MRHKIIQFFHKFFFNPYKRIISFYNNENYEEEALLNLLGLRKKSNYLCRSNATAQSIINVLLDGVVGSGIDFRVGVKKNKEKNEEIIKNLEEKFEEWADDCGLEGESFYEIIKQSYSSKLINGECFFHFPIINGKLKIQLIHPSEVIDINYYKKTGDVKNYKIQEKVITKYIKGRQAFFHYYEKMEPGQRRGRPLLSSSLYLIEKYYEYIKSEAHKAKLSASVFATIKKHIDNTFQSISRISKIGNNQNEIEEKKRQEILSAIKIPNGTVIDVPKGEEINIIKSDTVNTNFKDFLTQTLKNISANVGLPLSFLIKEHNRSYSAARMDKEMVENKFKIELELLKKRFLKIVFKEFVFYKKKMNDIDFINIDNYGLKTYWTISSLPHVDPAKESRAVDISLRNGTLTYQEYFSKKGKDWKDEMEQRAREMEKLNKLGINKKKIA